MSCSFCLMENAFTTWFPGPETFYACAGSAYDCEDITVVSKDNLKQRWPDVDWLEVQRMCDACLEVAVDFKAVCIE